MEPSELIDHTLCRVLPCPPSKRNIHCSPACINHNETFSQLTLLVNLNSKMQETVYFVRIKMLKKSDPGENLRGKEQITNLADIT